MERLRLVRRLRTPAAALCLIVCTFLIAFWVRSYRQVDNLMVRVSDTRVLGFSSGLGQLTVEFRSVNWQHTGKWHFITQPAAPIRAFWANAATPSASASPAYSLNVGKIVRPTLKFGRYPDTSILFMRHWIPVLATGVLAAVLGIRRPYRFSLRTLLIATTVIALVLGLVVAFGTTH